MKFLMVAAFWVAVVLAPTRAEAGILGVISGVEKGTGSYVISGWACDSGVASSVNVHFYVMGPAGVGTFVSSTLANVTSEQSVNTTCGTPAGTAHRFKIPISNQVITAYGGQSIHVHGISLSGGSNPVLQNSGAIQVPTVPWGVIGNIDGITAVAGGYRLTGWACDSGISQSIYVHVYVGGAAGTAGAQLLTYGLANVSTESAVNAACATAGGTAHRFQVPITHEMVNAHYLKPIYVHGVSVSGGPNFAIGRSGIVMMPDVGQIMGRVESVTDLGTSVEISGWACQYGVDQSVDVHLYAGGPVGTGTLVTGKTANASKTLASNEACGTVNSAHRFLISLSRTQLQPHIGKSIYVYGIHKLGDVANAVLEGNPSLPSFVTYQLSEKLPPTAGADLSIPAGEKLLIDTSADLGIINIQGQLHCPRTGDFVLKAQGILVEGDNSLFECGNATNRFLGSLVLKLKGGRELTSAMPATDHTHPSMGERAFAAMHRGTIRLFGDGRKQGWQRINATIARGSRTVVLSAPATDWKFGDRIAIGPTSYNYAEAEERIISSITSDGRTLQVDLPFDYDHYGVKQSYSNGVRGWTLDERAEVANLTRNIRIEPEGLDADLDSAAFGGHVMVMKSAFGYLDGIELVRMGQMGKMGRYPFHWHLAGPVPGQFIKNSSIRNSYQRCVSVHGTHEALVENNVCFNHFGHGFFLEDGNEVNNQLIGNLTILSKRVPKEKALLASDHDLSVDLTRFSPPGAFWISHPQNTVRGNVASGSQGTGFWMAFSQKLACPETGSCFVPDAAMPAPSGATILAPAQMSTTLFADNVAHGSDVGMTWDGAPDGALTSNPLNPMDRKIVASHYHHRGTSNPNGDIPVLDRLVTFKNKLTGVYARASTMTFRDFIGADNGNTLFFAYNQVVSDSLIVGFSANHSNADLDFHLANRGWGGKPFQGVRLYDGPFDLRNIHFAGFPSQQTIYGSWKVTPVPFYAIGGHMRFVNSVQGLTFSPEPYQRIALDAAAGVVDQGWKDSVLTSAIRDLDGSLGGVAGTVIVADHPLNRDPSCEPVPNTTALRCRYTLAFLGFGHTEYSAGSGLSGNIVPSRFERSDGAFDEYGTVIQKLWNKTMVILDRGYRYKVIFPSWAVPTVPRIWFQAHSQDSLSPVIELVGLKSSCVPLGATQVGSLSELESLTTTSGPASYYKTATGDIFLRLRGNQVDERFRSSTAMSATTKHLHFQCP